MRCALTRRLRIAGIGAFLSLAGWAGSVSADATAVSTERTGETGRAPVSARGVDPVEQTATVLQYEEQEPGTELYQTRLIVTPRYLRIDDGSDARDFLLFDRADRTIYSVSAADASVLIIKYSAATARVTSPQKHETVEEHDRAPDIDGKTVRHYRLLTDNRQCYDLYAADGLLPQAVAAWREYRESLAAEQARTLAWTPPEMRTTCQLANNIYAAGRFLAHGLPVRYAETDGKVGQLVDYRSGVKVDGGLFELPPAYSRISIDALRRGRR